MKTKQREPSFGRDPLPTLAPVHSLLTVSAGKG